MSYHSHHSHHVTSPTTSPEARFTNMYRSCLGGHEIYAYDDVTDPPSIIARPTCTENQSLLECYSFIQRVTGFISGDTRQYEEVEHCSSCGHDWRYESCMYPDTDSTVEVRYGYGRECNPPTMIEEFGQCWQRVNYHYTDAPSMDKFGSAALDANGNYVGCEHMICCKSDGLCGSDSCDVNYGLDTIESSTTSGTIPYSEKPTIPNELRKVVVEEIPPQKELPTPEAPTKYSRQDISLRHKGDGDQPHGWYTSEAAKTKQETDGTDLDVWVKIPVTDEDENDCGPLELNAGYSDTSQITDVSEDKTCDSIEMDSPMWNMDSQSTIGSYGISAEKLIDNLKQIQVPSPESEPEFDFDIEEPVEVDDWEIERINRSLNYTWQGPDPLRAVKTPEWYRQAFFGFSEFDTTDTSWWMRAFKKAWDVVLKDAPPRVSGITQIAPPTSTPYRPTNNRDRLRGQALSMIGCLADMSVLMEEISPLMTQFYPEEQRQDLKIYHRKLVADSVYYIGKIRGELGLPRKADLGKELADYFFMAMPKSYVITGESLPLNLLGDESSEVHKFAYEFADTCYDAIRFVHALRINIDLLEKETEKTVIEQECLHIPIIDMEEGSVLYQEGPIMLNSPKNKGVPVWWTAEGLPPGVSLNSVTGELSCCGTENGAYDVMIRAGNRCGEYSEKRFVIVVGGRLWKWLEESGDPGITGPMGPAGTVGEPDCGPVESSSSTGSSPSSEISLSVGDQLYLGDDKLTPKVGDRWFADGKGGTYLVNDAGKVTASSTENTETLLVESSAECPDEVISPEPTYTTTTSPTPPTAVPGDPRKHSMFHSISFENEEDARLGVADGGQNPGSMEGGDDWMTLRIRTHNIPPQAHEQLELHRKDPEQSSYVWFDVTYSESPNGSCDISCPEFFVDILDSGSCSWCDSVLHMEHEVPGYPIATHTLDGVGTFIGWVVEQVATKVKVLLATDITKFNLDTESFSIVRSGREFVMTELGQTGCINWESGVELDKECEQNPCTRNMKFTLLNSDEHPPRLLKTEYEITKNAVQPKSVDIEFVTTAELKGGDLVIPTDIHPGYVIYGNTILLVDGEGKLVGGDYDEQTLGLVRIGNVLHRKIKVYNPNYVSLLVDISSKISDTDEFSPSWFISEDVVQNSYKVSLDPYETKEIDVYINSGQTLSISSLHGCDLEHPACLSQPVGFELLEVT